MSRQLTFYNCSQSVQSSRTRECSSLGSPSASSPSSSSPSTLYESQVPPDVAQGPAFSPVRPRGITFPSRNFLGKLLSCLDTIAMETVLAKRALKDKDMTSLNYVIHEVYQLKAAFPSLLKLLQITQTIPVSTAECQRSFSALKRIKTYLRSTMSNDRLSNLAILSIEKDLSKNISLEEVVEECSRSGSVNCRIVLIVYIILIFN